MEALWKAKEIFSDITFSHRIEKYEKQIRDRTFFQYGNWQFHKNGEVFLKGKLEFNVKDKDISKSLGPFQLSFIKRKERSGWGRVAAKWNDLYYTVDISEDRDCILYMFKHVYGLSWANQRIPQKDN